MDPTTYEIWWQLHLRAAKGETLSPVEEAEYQAGTAKFDKEEQSQLRTNSLTALLKLRTKIDELQAIHSKLLATSTQLDAQIKVMEQLYQARTGYQLAHESS